MWLGSRSPTKDASTARVYGDDEVHQVEMERIFAWCWLFVGHTSQLPETGDFITTFMGEDPVIVSRGRDGKVRVFLNACSHKGRTVCQLDQGNAKTFMCPYHGWIYRSDGSLGGVPNSEDAYYGELDKSSLGLVQARVEEYRGLIFATWDANAPPLVDYLGDITWYLDIALDRGHGGTRLIGPPHRFAVPANWKTGAENFVSDFQHANTTHASATPGPIGAANDGWQAAAGPGNGLFMARADNSVLMSLATRAFMTANAPDAVARLGELRGTGSIEPIAGTIFPNLSFNLSPTYPNLRMWMPRGPHEMEVWVWGLVDADVDETVQATVVRSLQVLFGVSGLLEQDDGDNWQAVTQSGRSHMVRNQWSSIGMGLGHEFTEADLPASSACSSASRTCGRSIAGGGISSRSTIGTTCPRSRPVPSTVPGSRHDRWSRHRSRSRAHPGPAPRGAAPRRWALRGVAGAARRRPGVHRAGRTGYRSRQPAS
jgi:phenylpropionate dioxygenase-like ring-hydroxylating dioxygenase large terminal subunit